MNKRFPILIFLVLLATLNLCGQIAPNTVKSFDPNYKLIFHNPVQDKNFYLLSLFQNQSRVRKYLQRNNSLNAVANQKISALQTAEKCRETSCYDRIFRLSETEIETVANILSLAASYDEFKELSGNHLRPSGIFIRYDQKSDAETLVAAWRDAARGLNHILDVFGLGKDAAYKDIDNVSFDVNSAEYLQILKAKAAEIKPSKNTLFFEPTLEFAMKLLEANRRDEAGRYEPLEAKDNKKVFKNLKKIKWDDFPYSVILVLGSGPSEKLGDAPNIGKIGMARADEAVKLFKEKKAPLIILSGGHVHPARTPFCEAVEMKKYIMQKYGIPEESIMIEPHARHTTTNVRNASRIMFRDRIPTGKKGLITSSESHIDYVAGEDFKKRFMDEIGYVPMQIFNRLSPVAIEFVPLPKALFMNSMETLDP